MLEWTWNEILLNRANYLLEILAWQRTKDGSKGRNKPEMFRPSFIEEKKKTEKGIVMTTDQLDAILAKPRQ